MKKQCRQAGFTLVEVIVVLVVLAILAAILIPAMTGWIDRAREKSAIAECRQVVLAAQGTATEAYATAPTLGSDTMMGEPYFSQIRNLSKASGSISSIAINARALVERVEYVTKNGIVVVYDIAQSPVYQISGSLSRPVNAGDINALAGRLLEQLRGQLFDNGTKTWNELGRDKQSKELQKALLGTYGDTYPQLTDEYLQKLKTKGLSDKDSLNLNWRPILSKDGSLLLAASNAATTTSHPLAVLIYYNGKFYYHAGYAGDGVTTAHVSDQHFELSALKDTPSDPPVSEWILLS